MIRSVECQDDGEENQSEDDFRIAKNALGARSGSHIENVARRWAYGEGANAIGYDAIQRQLCPTQTALAPIGEIS